MVSSYNVSGSWLAPSFRTIAGANCSTSTPCQLEPVFNCSATIDYFADSILLESKWGGCFTNTKIGDIGIITTWLRSMVTSDWKFDINANLIWEQLDPRVQSSYVMLWHYGMWQNDTFHKTMTNDEYAAWQSILTFSHMKSYSCDSKSICDKLDIRGDADVSGRGMLMAYAILAVLTTLYFLILTGDQFVYQSCQSRGEGKRRKKWDLVAESMRDTVDDFLNTALLFAVAMLGATVTRHLVYLNRKQELGRDDVWSYSLLGSTLTSVFSVFPCMVLQIVTELVSSHNQRLVLWCLVVALAIAVGVLSQCNLWDLFKYTEAFYRLDRYDTTKEYPEGYSRELDLELLTSTKTNYYRAMVWEQYCVYSADTRSLQKLVAAGLGVQTPCYLFCLLTTLAVLVPAISPIRPSSSPGEYIKHQYGMLATHFTWTMRYVRFFMGFFYLAMSWLFLGKFISYRREVKSLAPSTDEDSSWSFGQILALAQWMPVAISLLSSWRKHISAPVSQDKVRHDYEPIDRDDRYRPNTSYKLPNRQTTI